ncbi:S8 family peptidase [Streptomyces sp. URMC 123]|uniref:S8 family peptidase n=1 Tax=Streptomyces sp. URMC 123 TaxID=3423403 RepID=UPI003F1A67B4
MTPRSARSRRGFAIPLGMALTAALAFLPAAATAAPAGPPAAAPAPASSNSAGATGSGAQAGQMSYVVNVETGYGWPEKVKKEIPKAGGTIVHAYDQIGVIVVHSANPDFAKTLRAVRGVDSVGATRTAPLPAQSTTDVGTPLKLTAEQAEAAAARAKAGEDPMQPLQWDLPAIKADKAHEKTLGSADVTVAVLDTGVDDTHPDIAPNFDRAASVDCVGGKPNTADGAWRPYEEGGNAHGTHVAGEIAAPKNGVGMTGVAPGVKVSGIKVSTQGNSFFYTEAVVCGFVWAAEHGADITNNSYYVDPWMFNCKADPDQRALVDAIARAARYAERKGLVNLAAAGNEGYDLAADKLVDPSSPNDSTPADREIDPRVCLDLPTQLPGVVTVSATGAKNLKASYSNYGRGVVDIAAPGGDSTQYQPPAPPATNGLILGPVPGGGYAYYAGTSMATPHAAGVAALIKSTHPTASPAQVKAMLKNQADDLACPSPYDIDGDGTPDAVCEGSASNNGFYGAGLADALDAVTK